MEYTHPNQGVWHPDTLTPRMFWDGGVGGGFSRDSRLESFFDPFAQLPEAAVVRW